MDLLQGLDDNDLSDISLDYSMEADDSGIDACDARRSIRNYDPDPDDDVTSSSESNGERGEDRFLLQHVAWKNRMMLLERDGNELFGLNKVKKLYEPLSAEAMNFNGTDDDESILEVELTASGEDDEDSSVLELVIPLHNRMPKRPRIRVFQLICSFFCCRPLK